MAATAAAAGHHKALTGLLTALLTGLIAGSIVVATPAPPAVAAPPRPAAAPPAPAAPDQADRLAAEATKLRARMDGQHRRLEVLAEQLSGARERGRQLLLGTGELDERWQAAADELARARAELGLRTDTLAAANPGYWTSMRAGPAQAFATTARMRRLQDAVTEGRGRLARAEATMATMDLEKAQLSGSLVAQATEAERLHSVEQEAEALAASLQTELRRMDRRIAALIEAQRRREEEAARSAFATWAAHNGAGLPAAAAMPADKAVRRAIEIALGQRGKPYLWGAEGPDDFDCSGLMQFAYAAVGVGIPRVSRDQYAAYAKQRPVAMRDLRAGDLVFFADRPSDPRTIHHVGMYIGGGLMVEAPYTGAVVRTSSIMRSSYAGAVRPVP